MAKRILIVDDDAIDKTALKKLLEECSVTEVDDKRISVLREKSAFLDDIDSDVLFAAEVNETIVTPEWFAGLFEDINGGVSIVIYEDGGAIRLAYANERYYQLFGYTKEQFKSELKDPHDIIYPEDYDAAAAAVARVKETKQAESFRYRIIKRDKSIAYVRCNSSATYSVGINGYALISILTDITESAQQEQQSIVYLKRLDAIMKNMNSAVTAAINRSDGTFEMLFTNELHYRMLGYTKEQFQSEVTDIFHLIHPDDVDVVRSEALSLRRLGDVKELQYRVFARDGSIRWLRVRITLMSFPDAQEPVQLAVYEDITEQMEYESRQRISEEMLRIAAETDRRSMVVYDVKKNTCRAESQTLFSANYGDVFENVPQSLIDMGVTAPDSENELRALFARMRGGEKKIRISLQLHSGPDKYEWFECNATTIFDSDGLPDHAVLVFHNITEQRIKEAVFRKWQQSIDTRPAESYTLFRCNLSKHSSIDQQDGELLKIVFPEENIPFNNRTKMYVDEFVYVNDREKYSKLLDSDTLLAMFYRGDRFANLDYREINADGELSWRRLTVELVEYPNSTDVQAFLMYEDVDEIKKNEIALQELAKLDPLTGALNRGAFAEAVDEILRENPNSHCAIIMLDMDGFKQINDTFGHAAGDQALQDVAAVLRSYSKNEDLVCRLGGDEFLVCLRDVPYDAVIAKTAQQMCEHIRKAYNHEVLLSVSAGIAVYPRDGQSYDELYPNADKALYKVKQSGKGAYAFYSAIKEEQTAEITEALSGVKLSPQSPRGTKRRLLIIDDNELDRRTLQNIFNDDYLVETARNGAEAMILLRHYRNSVSAVLLKLLMPGIDGFTVLKRAQNDVDLRTIPMVVITSDEKHETLFKAFDLGAAEYVVKPVDADIVRMRVKAVISKAENERLRAQNSYLMLQRDEEAKYHTVLASTGTAVVEYDWQNHVYIYDNEISKHIAGSFDHRGLWQIFLSDMVAESSDVKALQDMLIDLAGDREKLNVTKLVKLKTPEGDKHWFRMNIYKRVDDFGLADKLIITFNDVHEEVIANDKLLFQATRDELTGLYNRAGFLQKAAELIKARELGYYVMACIDVEKFQVINDRYGTEKGDKVLKHIAASIGEFVERNNGICCRYTADKFAVLYPAKLLGSAELEKNHRIAASPKCIPRPLKICIGRCMVNEPSLTVSAIFDRAAMAESLAKGRYDTYIIDYDESMRDNILREQQIVGDMVDALNNGEFEPWLQPQYNHSTGALIGAEALVRWRKNGEIIPPHMFIPIFERNGFIYEVDQYIWRSVCILLRRWIDEGREPLPVSVNISRHDMFQDTFIDIITGLVAEYQLPVELLRLEITESAFSADTATITDIAGKLISAGFTLEIDDFGSGYSSLNTLKDVPASILKLDMRFFEQSGDAKRGGNIVESVVRMAKWLGMAVIAEGVEDTAQADYLKSIGCFYIQGYLYAKPMPVDEYEKRLDSNSKESQLTRLKTLQNLDNNDFWDSHSMDTLIFNSYVGAACILESYNGNLEMLRATEHYARMLGGGTLDIKDVLSINWMAHMDVRNINRLNDAVSESLKTKETITLEFEFHNLPGCPKLVVLRSNLRVIATIGERHLIYCLSDNITAQRAAEREAQSASERVNAVMDNSHCGISAVIAHTNGEVVPLFVNNRFFEMLGYTREQYTSEVKNPYDRFLPEDRERVLETVTKLAKIGDTASMEIREKRRDGSIIWIRGDVSIVRFANISKPVQIASFLDITEQKESEIKQLENSRQLEAVMSNINSGISAVYLKNGKPVCVLANEQHYRIFGYTKEEFEAEGINTLELIHPEDREETSQRFAEMQKYGESYTMEYRIIRRDGSVRNILSNTSVLRLLGVDEPVQLTVTNDITELREAQYQELAIKDRLNTVLNTMPNGITAVTFSEDGLKSLFANDHFYDLHGICRGDNEDESLTIASELVLPEFKKNVYSIFGEPEGSQRTVSAEYQIRRPDGVVRWLRVIVNVTRLVGIDVPVRVAVYSDITDERKANDQIRFLNESAGEILAQPDSEKAINDTLKKLLDYFAGERTYIFELHDETQTTDNTYELCAPGVSSEIERLQGVPYDTQQYWFDAFRKTGFVAIPDVATITDENEIAMRDLLLIQNIRSIVVAPLWRDDKLIGYIGIDNPSKDIDQISRLIAITDYIAVLLTRRDLMKSIERGLHTVQQLMDDTPGGFVRLELFENKAPVIVNANKGLCKMLDMTKDELMAVYGENAFDVLADDDAAAAADEIAEAYVSGGQYTSTCKLKKKDGSLLGAMFFGRFVRGENGRLFLNAYFTDITDKLATEEYQKTLLDNLPFGAAMYIFDGESLNVIHLNRQYWKLVGREATVYEKTSVTAAIHPDDREDTIQEIRSAIRQERNAEVDIRILNGKGGYLPFHVTASIIRQENGIYRLFVAYLPISD